MDINDLVQKGVDYFQTDPLVSTAAALIVLFLLFRKPKLFFLIILIALVAVGMKYIYTNLLSTGLEHKDVPFLK